MAPVKYIGPGKLRALAASRDHCWCRRRSKGTEFLGHFVTGFLGHRRKRRHHGCRYLLRERRVGEGSLDTRCRSSDRLFQVLGRSTRAVVSAWWRGGKSDSSVNYQSQHQRFSEGPSVPENLSLHIVSKAGLEPARPFEH